MTPMVYASSFEERISTMFSWDMDGSLYSSLFIMAILLVLAIIVGIRVRVALRKKEYLDRPKGLLMCAEWYCEFCTKFAKSRMGDYFEDMGGYFMTLFAYLFIAFNWGLTGLPTVIDWLAGPLSLSIMMFVLIQYTALRYQHLHYFHRFIEPFFPFLPINLVTMWTPIISTSMRLFGNCLSGTIVIGLIQWSLGALSDTFFAGVTAFAYSNYIPFWDVNQNYVWTSIWLAPIPMGILNLYFSLFSGFIQTTVFSTLTALWIAQERPVPEQPSLTIEAPRALVEE